MVRRSCRVRIGVGLCDLVVDHRNFLPAVGTGVLDLGPMPQALAVEDMLLRAQQYVYLFIDVEVLEADGAASASLDDVVDGGVFHRHVDVLEAFVGVGLAAAADEDHDDADDGRDSHDQQGCYQYKLRQANYDHVRNEVALGGAAHVDSREDED